MSLFDGKFCHQDDDNELFEALKSEITKLEEKLAEAKKDALRWRAVLHSEAYCPSDFGSNPIGFAGRLGQYTSEQINASADKYIAKYMTTGQTNRKKGIEVGRF